MLNLPWRGLNVFTKIEAHAGMVERLVRYLAIEEALQDEIKETTGQKDYSYFDWCDLSEKGKKKKKVKLIITYDMVWHKRSSGRRYDSSNGHAFIIDGIRKGIIGMILYSKACRKCDAAEKRGE